MKRETYRVPVFRTLSRQRAHSGGNAAYARLGATSNTIQWESCAASIRQLFGPRRAAEQWLLSDEAARERKINVLELTRGGHVLTASRETFGCVSAREAERIDLETVANFGRDVIPEKLRLAGRKAETCAGMTSDVVSDNTS